MIEYKFNNDIQFSKGGLDELIALDRYAITSTDSEYYMAGNTVVFISDELKGTKLVGEIEFTYIDGRVLIKSRDGKKYTVNEKLVTKVLEIKPQDFWARWAYGAASQESEEKKHYWENEFRWLLDNYKYSPGGRIQISLGHEYYGLPKSPLTGTNCFVQEKVKGSFNALEQWNHVIDILIEQMHINRKGGGNGINPSNIEEINGPQNNVEIYLTLPKKHEDYNELIKMQEMGKFKNVLINCWNLCHVHIVEDSIEGLIEALRKMIRHSYENINLNLDFSMIRERNAIVKGVNGRSSGAAAWMELFSLTSSLLKQNTIDVVDFCELYSFAINLIQQGGSRRGALMLALDVNHPKIEKFITRKLKQGYLSGANISVCIDDKFMEELKNQQQNNINSKETKIWDLIIKSAHTSAEPGIIWLERCNKESNSWYFNELIATNP